MLQKLKDLFSLQAPPELQARLEQMIKQTPVPVFWLLGKTQSGKTSIVRSLTGAENAEIGQGYKPCTRFSHLYNFPTEETPLLKFLDTRGIDEPGYDAAEDLARFNNEAHVLIVTVRVLDQALGNLIKHVREIRDAKPSRPLILIPTTLHEAYPQQQHPEEYPFQPVRPKSRQLWTPENEAKIAEPLRVALKRQMERFDGLFDYVVPIDFTLPEEGYNEAYYGASVLKDILVEALPQAYRQTLIHVEETTGELRDLYARQALPYLIKFSGLAAAAGALPLPWIDNLIVPAIQTRMITQLATLYGQPVQANQFKEMAGALGLGMAAQKAFVRFLPFLGAKVGGAAAWAGATFALGKACCYYFSSIRTGHVPQPEELKQYYQHSVSSAQNSWRKTQTPAPETA